MQHQAGDDGVERVVRQVEGLGDALLVAIVVLGIRKLPELTRSAEKATRILKSEARAVEEQESHHPVDGSGRVVSGTVAE
ncbi:twin-arginine translocase TatA/TatE family subunit [Streptomyces sp. NPDC002172]